MTRAFIVKLTLSPAEANELETISDNVFDILSDEGFAVESVAPWGEAEPAEDLSIPVLGQKFL